MSKLLVRFSLLWSFALFLSPGPALGDFESGDCTVDDSPVGTLVTSVLPTCSNDSAAVQVVARSYDDIRNGDRGHSSLLVRIDYICIGHDGQQIRGTPWTTDHSDRRIDVTNLDTFFDVKDYSNPQFIATVQRSLQPGTNCTFYLCYKQRRSDRDYFGRASPVSCVIPEINECDTANGGCEHSCTNTIGSFICSCYTGYRLDQNGLNCSDIDECKSTDLNNCHENEICVNTEGGFTCQSAPVQATLMWVPNDIALNDTDECNNTNGGCEQVCTNTLGGFYCSCYSGYQREGSNCSDINECNTTNGGCEHSCTNTIGSFNCSCNTGYQLDENGLNCTDIDECENDDLNDCHDNASCTNTKGSYSCSCNDGYSGSGTECTDIDECKTGNNSCHENAQCTNTEGSFTCSCNSGYTGDGTECSMVLTVVLLSVWVLVVIAVVLMITAIVCGSICVVQKLRKMNAERSKIKLCFSDDVVDLNYSPVSPFSTLKLKTVASVTSVFDMLGIPDRKSQTSNADSASILDTASMLDTESTLDTDSTLDTESTLDTDAISDVLRTLLHHNSITTTVTPNVCMSIFVETGTDASSSPSSITEHFDFTENVSCKAEVNSNGTNHLDLNVTHPTAFSEDAHAASCTSTSKDRVHSAKKIQSSSGYVSDTVISNAQAASRTSAVEAFAGDSTAACNSAGQNGEYVHGDYLLQGSHVSPDVNNQSVESDSEFLQYICLEVAEEVNDLQLHSVMSEASKDEGHLAKEQHSSSGYVADVVACADSRSSAVESFTGDSDDTALCHSAGQNDVYVRSEYQFHGSHGSLGLNSHIVELESEFLSSMYHEEAVDPQSHSVNDMVEASKGEALATKELQFSLGYVSDTHLIASVVENPNVLGLQDLEDSSNHSVVEDDVSTSKISPQVLSENYSTTSDCTFGYFDDSTHSHLSVSRVQHLSANRGYITDFSKPEEDVPYSMQHMN